MENQIIIRERGLNGSQTFSIFSIEKKVTRPVITNKKINCIVRDLIRLYPSVAKEISKFYYYDFSGDFPKEINLENLGSQNKADLIEAIAEKIPYK